jgi:GTP cyclohydrolase II
LLHVQSGPPTPLATRFGEFTLHRFREEPGAVPALALSLGDPSGSEPLLARVHSSCLTSEFLGSLDCDCAEQLGHALAAIARAGRGVLLYLMQEGRGAGLVAKARDRMMVQAHDERISTFEAFDRLGLPRDHRRYETVPDLLSRLGVRAALRLLTHNPEKCARLRAVGVQIAETVTLPSSGSRWNAHYLTSKAGQGHALAAPAQPSARLPEPVSWFEPHVLAGLPRFERKARYLLPLPEGWLRATVYWDATLEKERLVLTSRAPGRGRPGPPIVLPQALVDRMPLAPVGATQRSFRRAAPALVNGDIPAALVLAADEEMEADAETRALLRADAAA